MTRGGHRQASWQQLDPRWTDGLLALPLDPLHERFSKWANLFFLFAFFLLFGSRRSLKPVARERRLPKNPAIADDLAMAREVREGGHVPRLGGRRGSAPVRTTVEGGGDGLRGDRRPSRLDRALSGRSGAFRRALPRRERPTRPSRRSRDHRNGPAGARDRARPAPTDLSRGVRGVGPGRPRAAGTRSTDSETPEASPRPSSWTARTPRCSGPSPRW